MYNFIYIPFSFLLKWFQVQVVNSYNIESCCFMQAFQGRGFALIYVFRGDIVCIVLLLGSCYKLLKLTGFFFFNLTF